jgi:tripartite-type tricarboxylate transporter receptor subunit TctC
MNFFRRRLLAMAAGLAVAPTILSLAVAQPYPARSITLVVPYPAGGPTDLVARIMAEPMRVAFGQPVIVENVAGGSGNIGVGRVVRSAPNGYTLVVSNNGSIVLNGALYALSFDALRDLDPIALMSSNPQIIISKKDIPARNLSELIAWLRDNQQKVSVGIAGSMAAVSAVHFQNITSAKFQLVPYRGAAPAIQDLIGGQIELMFDQLSNALPQVKSGNVKGYAIAASRRSPSAADIPSVDEVGLPGFYGALWQGLWAPKGLPQEVTDRISAVVMQILADPAIRQRLADAGQDVVPPEQQTPAWLAAYQKSEAEKWWPIIKAANLKGE